jgi:hypothetical protein
VFSQESGRYTFLVLPSDDDPKLKEHSGTLDPETLRKLQALLSKELASHYTTENPVKSECLEDGGYQLTGTGGGCWIEDKIDAVSDEKTKELLSVLVPLYKEKLEECLAEP